MEELIKKKNPCKRYETALLPDYFSQQAANGYLLKMVSGNTFYFEKAQPKELEYRCVLLGNVDYEEKKKQYELEGWTFVDRIAEYDIIYAAKRMHYVLDEKEKEKKKQAVHRMLTASVRYVFGVSFSLGLLLEFRRPGTVLGVDWTKVIAVPTLAVLIVLFTIFHFLSTLIQFLKYINTQRIININTKQTHRKWKYEGYKKIQRVLNTAVCVCLVAMLLTVVIDVECDQTEYLEEEQVVSLPLLQVQQIKELASCRGINSGYFEDKNWLATKEYDNIAYSDEYDQVITQHYYELRFKGIVLGTIKSLLGEETSLEMESEGVDHVYYKQNEQGEVTDMAVCKENKILYVQLLGGADKETLLSYMKQQLS